MKLQNTTQYVDIMQLKMAAALKYYLYTALITTDQSYFKI